MVRSLTLGLITGIMMIIIIMSGLSFIETMQERITKINSALTSEVKS
jgi:hypothetical protein